MDQTQWRILVVEDDPDGQEMVATILAHLNIPFDVASNAEEAEQFLFHSSRRYTAAILDLALPGKNGWELLAEILAAPETASLTCVAVTAFHTSKLREEAIKAGFSAYFAKPLDTTSFGRRLQEML